MANPYDNNTPSFCPPSEPDEFSLFLHQFLLRSSSSPFPVHASGNVFSENVQEQEIVPGPCPDQGPISMTEHSSRLSSFSNGWVQVQPNVSSSSVGTLENDPNEYDCESEEVGEIYVEETVTKPKRARNSSKRSRAAEVHNMSEKMRRSRINEKMKALQNLIPNSNKTDKASMLDEAIDYLKQLQLQVQMLTMRNGLGLYPFCQPRMMQPGQASEKALNIHEIDKSSDFNMAKAISTDQDISADNLLKFPENCSRQAQVSDFSTMTGSKASFGIESHIRHNLGPYQFSNSTTGLCREEVFPFQQLDEECLEMTLTGTKSKYSIPPSAHVSKLEDGSFEACLEYDGCLNGARGPPSWVANPIFSSQRKDMTLK